MSFTPFDPLPASDLNDIVENIESLEDYSGYDDDSLPAKIIDFTSDSTDPNGGIWWEEIGRTTLGSAGDTITVSSLPARKYLKIIYYTSATGGTANNALRFNNDSGTNYANRRIDDGSSSTNTSQTSINGGSGTDANPVFVVVELVNIANKEKIGTAMISSRGSAGAGNVPTQRMTIFKWANTADQITRVDITNDSGTGDYASGSEVIVLGHD